MCSQPLPSMQVRGMANGGNTVASLLVSCWQANYQYISSLLAFSPTQPRREMTRKLDFSFSTQYFSNIKSPMPYLHLLLGSHFWQFDMSALYAASRTASKFNLLVGWLMFLFGGKLKICYLSFSGKKMKQIFLQQIWQMSLFVDPWNNSMI